MATISKHDNGQGNSRNIQKIYGVISQIPEKILLVIMVITLLDMVLSVTTRYVTGRAIYWAEEVGTIGLVWITMIGAGVCIKRNIHFIMPTFIDVLPPRIKIGIVLTSHTLVVIFGVLMIFTGFEMTLSSAAMLSPALEINLGIINSAAVVGGVLIVIYGVAKFMGIFTGKAAPSEEVH